MTTDPTAGPTMKALRAHRRGGPEQLVYEDAPRPTPGALEVSVRVGAAAITFDELTWPETWERDGVDRTPVIPSHEFAGVVADVGSDVTDLVAGDRVFGLVPFNRDGAAAELVVVPEGCCARTPAGVADAVAAAAVLPALTAWEALSEHLGGMVAGQRLLVHGGTGAVGAFLVQFAHGRGLHVTATVRTAESIARAEQLGADEVVVSPADGPPHLAPVDAAVNAAGAETPAWLYAAVRRGGQLITLQAPPDEELVAQQGIESSFFVVSLRRDRMQELGELLGGRGIDVAIAQELPLSEGRGAYERRRRGSRAGKTVLLVPSQASSAGL